MVPRVVWVAPLKPRRVNLFLRRIISYKRTEAEIIGICGVEGWCWQTDPQRRIDNRGFTCNPGFVIAPPT